MLFKHNNKRKRTEENQSSSDLLDFYIYIYVFTYNICVIRVAEGKKSEERRDKIFEDSKQWKIFFL